MAQYGKTLTSFFRQFSASIKRLLSGGGEGGGGEEDRVLGYNFMKF